MAYSFYNPNTNTNTNRSPGGPRISNAQNALGRPSIFGQDALPFREPPPPYTSQLPLDAAPRETNHGEAPPRNRILAPSHTADVCMGNAELRASHPARQWRHQVRAETERIMDDARRHPAKYVGTYPGLIADANIKQSWLDQGIWNKRWGDRLPFGAWRHEEPSESDSEAEAEAEVEHDPLPGFNLFMPRSEQPVVQRRQQTDEERETRKRKREKFVNASRPFNQFNYQVAKESERLEAELSSVVLINTDVNTKAYRNVKNSWINRNIWDDKWGILPGMSWKHERPLDFTPPAQHDPPRGDRLETRPLNLFGQGPISNNLFTGILNTRTLFGGAPVPFATATETRDHHAVDIQAEPSSSPPESSPPAPRRHSSPNQVSQSEIHSPPSNPDEGEPVNDEPNATIAPLRRSKRLANATKEINDPSESVSGLVGETVQPSAGPSQPRVIGKRKRSSQQQPRKGRKIR